MTSETIWLLLLFPAGMLAGTFNVIAGGGSFLTLPVLMAAGLPVEVANGTNRISVALQGSFAAYDFKKKDSLDGSLYRRMLPPLLAGALVGAWLATRIDPARLEKLFGAVFLLMAAVLLLRHQRVARERKAVRGAPPRNELEPESKAPEPATAVAEDHSPDRPSLPAEHLTRAPGPAPDPSRQPHALRYVVLFFVGVYGGFIQAGVGLWILLSGVSLFARDAVTVNSVKLPLTLTFTVPALLLFLHAGMVEWLPGLILAVGTVVGTAIGVRLTLRGGAELIFRAVTLVLLVTGAHLLFFR